MKPHMTLYDNVISTPWYNIPVTPVFCYVCNAKRKSVDGKLVWYCYNWYGILMNFDNKNLLSCLDETEYELSEDCDEAKSQIQILLDTARFGLR